MKHFCFIHQDLSILLPSALGNKYLWVNEWMNEWASTQSLKADRFAAEENRQISVSKSGKLFSPLFERKALFKGFLIQCFIVQKKTAGKSRLHQSCLNAPIPNSDGNPFIQKYHWCTVNINSTNEYSMI